MDVLKGRNTNITQEIDHVPLVSCGFSIYVQQVVAVVEHFFNQKEVLEDLAIIKYRIDRPDLYTLGSLDHPNHLQDRPGIHRIHFK